MRKSAEPRHAATQLVRYRIRGTAAAALLCLVATIVPAAARAEEAAPAAVPPAAPAAPPPASSAPAPAPLAPAPAPSAPAPSLGSAVDRYLAGAPLHALDDFIEIAQAEPTASTPMIWAGIAATAAGRTGDAAKYFRQALERTPTAFQERIIRGWLARLSMLWVAVGGRPGTAEALASLARGANPQLSAQRALWLGDRLLAAAKQHRVDPWLLAAVVYVESRFDQTAISRRGAMGLGQLMPQTARAAGVNPRDPWGNLLGAAMTLRGCYQEFGNWSLALAAYNAGGGAVRRYGGIPPFAETRWYVKAVLALYQRIRPG